MMKTPKKTVRVRLMKPESAKAPNRRMQRSACGAAIVSGGERVQIKGHTLACNAEKAETETASIGEQPGILFDEGPYAPCLLRKTPTKEIWGFRPISSVRRQG
jgi:hypothetical protein